MYVDESGSINLKHGKYYTISGIIIQEFIVQHIEKEIEKFKLTHFGNSNVEIHTYDLWCGETIFQDIHITQRKTIMGNLYESIRLFPITIISVIIDKDRINRYYNNWNVLVAAWSFMVERFDMFLNCNNQKGMLIIDKNMKKPDKEIYDLIQCLRKNGTNYHQVQHIIEQPLFINSLESIGLQLADSIAYCVYKKFSGSNFEDFHDRCIWPKYRGDIYSNEHNGYGLKIFP